MALGIIVNWGFYILQSNAFLEFLHDKIIELLITLLAINTATISIVVTKLYDIEKQSGADFTKTIKEVKISLIEQIILIATASLILVLCDSKVIQRNFNYHGIFFNTIITSIFIYSIDILRDTGFAIFEINKYDTKKK